MMIADRSFPGLSERTSGGRPMAARKARRGVEPIAGTG